MNKTQQVDHTVIDFVRNLQEEKIKNRQVKEAAELGKLTGLGIMVDKDWLNNLVNQSIREDCPDNLVNFSGNGSYSVSDMYGWFKSAAKLLGANIEPDSLNILANKLWRENKFHRLYHMLFIFVWDQKGCFPHLQVKSDDVRKKVTETGGGFARNANEKLLGYSEDFAYIYPCNGNDVFGMRTKKEFEDDCKKEAITVVEIA